MLPIQNSSLHYVTPQVQPAIIERKSVERYFPNACRCKCLYQLLTRIPITSPNAFDQQLRQPVSPRDEKYESPSLGKARAQTGKNLWKFLFRDVLKHRGRNNQVIVCPRRGQLFQVKYIDLAKFDFLYPSLESPGAPAMGSLMIRAHLVDDAMGTTSNELTETVLVSP